MTCDCDFRKFVEEARTCRRFNQAAPLSEQDLDWLVDCARLTPSARNQQELRFITVRSGKTLDALFPLTKWAGALKDWGGPAEGERPTGFIAVLVPENAGELIFYDAGIAVQTIQLAAHSKGFGCCIIKSFDVKKSAELLAVPQGMKIALILGLGVAVEKRVIADIPENGTLNYWRDADCVHHVPKRPLEALIVARF